MTAASFHPTRFRSVLGRFATGVVIVTGEGPTGMACNSFTSVSLDPPLVAFCPGASSTTWPKIRATGRFAINFLAHHHEHLCRRFAALGIDRFEGLRWQTGTSGCPLLEDAVAHIECRLAHEHEAGDHTIVVGEVLWLDAAEDIAPLVFFGGRYGTFAAA